MSSDNAAAANKSGTARLLQPFLDSQRRTRRFLDTAVLRTPSPRWTTPNRVIMTRGAFRLRDFSRPCSEECGQAPVLVVPPEVNQSCIVDFGPGQSLVQTVLESGFPRVAALEWLSATRETAARDIDDSLTTILECIEALGGRVHLIGLCQGGWESAAVAALRPSLTASLTLVAAPIDCHAGFGTIQALASTMPMSAYRALVLAGGGVMRGQFISWSFDTLVPFERFFLKYLSLWNHLDDREWVDRFEALNDWYRYPKDLPGPMYLRAVRELFKENRLFQGRFVALGERVDLGNIRCPLALVAGTKDHITPPPQVWAAKRAVGSPDVLEVEIPAGHVGTFMGRAALRDYWPRLLGWLAEKAPPR